jgi:MotA/TolQ/ExbB proton channel family
MANSTIKVDAHSGAARARHPAAERTSAVTDALIQLRRGLASPQLVQRVKSDIATDGVQIAFLSRAVVLQAIGAAMLAGLWIAGLAGKPFEGNNGALCWIILGMGALGIGCVFMKRWNDVQWLATHVVRIGLLGTVVGLIIAFSAAGQGGSANPDEIKPMIAAVVNGMYVSLYATLLGIGTNLWLKINMRLLGNIHG